VASVANATGIIGQPFYAVLVMLAIVTSLLAGSWLAHIPENRLLAGQPAIKQPSPGPLTTRASGQLGAGPVSAAW